MRKGLLIIFSIVTIIALSNFTFIGPLLGKPIIHVYNYESTDRKFNGFEIPEKGRSLDFVKAEFNQYISNNNASTELHRTTKRNPLKFYEWYDYLSHERWQYEYMEPSKSN